MQCLYYVFYAYATTVHTLIRLKTFWRVYLVKPQKLGVAITAVTLKFCVHVVISLLPTMALRANQILTIMYQSVVITAHTSVDCRLYGYLVILKSSKVATAVNHL